MPIYTEKPSLRSPKLLSLTMNAAILFRLAAEIGCNKLAIKTSPGHHGCLVTLA
jgi:hypothetical protein